MTVPSMVLDDARAGTLRRALKLEYLTVGWDLVEGGVGITAAVLAGGGGVWMHRRRGRRQARCGRTPRLGRRLARRPAQILR
jgi:hypothetical protein